MSSLIKNLFLSCVGLAWTILDDFEPKRTIDEMTRLVDDLRSQTFDRPNEELRTRVSAQLTAIKEAHRVLVQNNGPENMIQLLSERITVLDRLLTPVLQERDVFAGSLSGESFLKPEWQRIEEHPSTVGFLAQQGKRVVSRLFEDRDLHDETIQLRTRLRVHKEVLLEVHDLLAPENRQAVQTRLAALDAAEQALRGQQRQSQNRARMESAGIAADAFSPRMRPTSEKASVRSSRRREEIHIESY